MSKQQHGKDRKIYTNDQILIVTVGTCLIIIILKFRHFACMQHSMELQIYVWNQYAYLPYIQITCWILGSVRAYLVTKVAGFIFIECALILNVDYDKWNFERNEKKRNRSTQAVCDSLAVIIWYSIILSYSCSVIFPFKCLMLLLCCICCCQEQCEIKHCVEWMRRSPTDTKLCEMPIANDYYHLLVVVLIQWCCMSVIC